MIINQPNSEEFQKLAHNCLAQAFNLIFEMDKAIFDFGEKALKEDVWKYSQGRLNTAVVLIHQTIESFMKASICETSPLLLLEGRRKDWPVLPGQDDRDFNDFYSTPAEALLRTYAATTKRSLSPDVVDHVEAIRTLRNRIVHGISRTALTPKKLIEDILDTFLLFEGPDVWWNALLQEFANHPLADAMGIHFGTQLAEFAERLDYVEASVGKAKFDRQFTLNTRARRYICPFCKLQWDAGVGYGRYPYTWAFLDKDSEGGPVVICLNCNIETPVVRKDCWYTACKGSVRFYGEDKDEIFCLTCGQIQYSGTEAEYVARQEQRRLEEQERVEKYLQEMLAKQTVDGQGSLPQSDAKKKRNRKKNESKE
ncbi:hypothetical protein EJV47_24870 [Hymenobacter gummosus]|uniref:Uncharacterized protein n=1 Tax=Hymenobacter gummosus TaxID=1776032 RepID=A0A431TVZ7_9BACT|nr:hypothetical protein [Hymenobacter gummosus]RTQ45722.1 hypothetical protein EJV47_24870 [Hymenobacter gummosus]